jgi:hypothetical protein
VYFIDVMCTALSSVLLIAPTAHHRLNFRQRSKEPVVKVANILAIVGTAFLAAAIATTVYLITDVLYGVGLAAVVAGALAGGTVVLWYVVPFWERRAAR